MKFSDIFLNDGTLSPTLILWLLYIAIIISTVIYFTVNYQLGKIVSRLLELNVTTTESAKTMDEIGIKSGFFTSMCLKSHLNYKDLLVAITSDGKYYANMRYTDEEPTFKLLRAITRKRKSRINKENNSDEKNLDQTASIDTDAPENNEFIEKNLNAINFTAENTDEIQITGAERVKFNIYTAKYYIPREVHDKARGIFKTSKTNIFLVIAALLGLGVIIYFAGFLADGLIDSFTSIGK